MKSLKSTVWSFTPPALLAYYARRRWDREDHQDWPNRKARGSNGIEEYEYRLFSQNGEDGIIRHILGQMAGTRCKKFVEFGFGVFENNCLRLILKEDYEGLYLDGNIKNVRVLKSTLSLSRIKGVRARQSFITAENINSLLLRNDATGEVDLLSIDVDGVDYWIWEAITVLSPRLFVVEYNATFGPTRSVTVPYESTFNRMEKDRSGYYHGASLAALAKSATRRGYVLVGCDSAGANAFFVRSDCMAGALRSVEVSDAYRPSASRTIRRSLDEQFDLISHLPLVEI